MNRKQLTTLAGADENLISLSKGCLGASMRKTKWFYPATSERNEVQSSTPKAIQYRTLDRTLPT